MRELPSLGMPDTATERRGSLQRRTVVAAAGETVDLSTH